MNGNLAIIGPQSAPRRMQNKPWRPDSGQFVPPKKYFKQFEPWTADVQGPPLNFSLMKVVKTIMPGRPAQNRALLRPARVQLRHRPPSVSIFKFRVLFPPGPPFSTPIKISTPLPPCANLSHL